MLDTSRLVQKLFTLAQIGALVWLPVAASAQDLVPISSLTGGSSVFVFRNAARAARRVIPIAKPARTKSQQMETVAKLNKQYTATSKLHRESAKVLEPAKLPGNIHILPPAQASKLFAGVGEYYLAHSDLDKATEFFRDAVNLDATDKAATDGLSDALSIQGNTLLAADQASGAKGYFLEALTYNPNNAGALFGLGEVYSQLDQTKEAIDAYEKSLAANKDLTEIFVPLGILYYQSGDIAKADALLTKAIAASGNSPETQLFLGLVRFAQGQKDAEALAAFQKADQTQPETQFYTGETLVRLKRTAEAVPFFKKATELKPTYFDAWFSLGEANYELGHWDDAAAAYKQAVRLKNTDWATYAGLGDSLRQGGKFDEATGNYRNAATFYVQQKEFNHETAGELYSKIGLAIGQQCDLNMQRGVECQWASAVKALQKALELTNDPIDEVNLGWAYFRWAHPDAEGRNLAAAKPNLELARDILTKAVAAGPPAADFALQNLASVQIDLGDYKSAIDTFGKLVKSKPDTTFNKYALGVAYYKSGDAANGEKWLRDAVQAEPANVSYMMALGDVYINRKNGKDAHRLADQIRAINPQAAAQLDLKIKLSRL
ncbi:MAG: tetratricopeptide repeat protein [Pyrinomonadaceae bacterium]